MDKIATSAETAILILREEGHETWEIKVNGEVVAPFQYNPATVLGELVAEAALRGQAVSVSAVDFNN